MAPRPAGTDSVLLDVAGPPDDRPRGGLAPRQPVVQSPRQDMLWAAVAAALILLGLAVRVVLLQRYYVVPDADQSVLGLMARHILQGERPVFYWGQSYTGSGEAYLTAALFRLLGQSNLLLHVVPLAASTLFTALTAALAWRLYGPGIAGLTCAFLGVGPMLLVGWSLWAGSGYLESMAAGVAALLLVLQPAGKRLGAGSLVSAFFLLGLAVWIQPTGVYYLVSVAAALTGRIARATHESETWAARIAIGVFVGLAFCAGASPLIVYNLQHEWATFAFLSSHSTDVAALTVVARTVLWAGPVLTGLLPPTTDRSYFLHFILDHLPLYGVSLAIVLLLLFRVLSLWRLALRRVRVAAPGDLALVALTIAVLGGYLGTGWGGEQWSGSQPRYLLPLYSAVPLIIRLCMPLTRKPWHWAVAWIAVVGIAGAGIAVNTTSFARSDVAPLGVMLEDNRIRAVYGDYWLVYPLTLSSSEQVVGVAVNDNLSKGLLSNRYSPYLRAAASTTDFAWIASRASAREASILRCLTRLRSRYTVLRWRDQVIYVRPTGRAFPWWNGGRCSTTS